MVRGEHGETGKHVISRPRGQCTVGIRYADGHDSVSRRLKPRSPPPGGDIRDDRASVANGGERRGGRARPLKTAVRPRLRLACC